MRIAMLLFAVFCVLLAPAMGKDKMKMKKDACSMHTLLVVAPGSNVHDLAEDIAKSTGLKVVVEPGPGIDAYLVMDLITSDIYSEASSHSSFTGRSKDARAVLSREMFEPPPLWKDLRQGLEGAYAYTVGDHTYGGDSEPGPRDESGALLERTGWFRQLAYDFVDAYKKACHK